MKKKQKINKAVNYGEWLLLGFTALFLCFLFVVRERPAPTRGIAVRTTANRAPDAVPGGADVTETASASDGGANLTETAPASETSDGGASLTETAPADDADDGRVNINTADLSELCALPGVGEALAKRIIDYREEHGAFARPEDVTRVSGIGEGKFAAMRGLITV